MEKMFMNLITGSVDTYEGWNYEDIDGNMQNAVDMGEVVEVREANGNWTEV